MDRSIEENINIILDVIAKESRDKGINASTTGDQLAGATNLTAVEINDAVTLLVESGLAEWIRTLGTAPYTFHSVTITPRGKYEHERTESAVPQAPASRTMTILPPTPIGSPYGFEDGDWEAVSESKANLNRLRVVLGFQFTSQHYIPDELKQNVERMFQQAVTQFNQEPGNQEIDVDFRPLAAGYGEHLFNEIARDIISADIAVFDTSDLNPNVMIEMGVALTWGVRVLPIKAEGCQKPPSDISGQMWADYTNSAESFVDPEHHQKLVRMVERAIRKKSRS